MIRRAMDAAVLLVGAAVGWDLLVLAVRYVAARRDYRHVDVMGVVELVNGRRMA